MADSKLITVTNLSPNYTKGRKHAIDTITIHAAEGQVTAKALGEWFAKESTHASSNYGVGKDGSIGLYVHEKDRSWCSSSSSNDNRAITIEVASDKEESYNVNEKAYKALINLLIDICQRNGIKKLLWQADKSLIGQVDKQNITLHRWFKDKACPGTWLIAHMSDICEQVNAQLEPKSILYKVQVGAYSVKKNAEDALKKVKAAGFPAIIKAYYTDGSEAK